MPPRLGDTIRLSIFQSMVKIKLKLSSSTIFHWSITRDEAAYITKEDGLFYYCSLRPCKHILCIYVHWVHIFYQAGNCTLKACLGAWPKAYRHYKTR